MDVKRANFLYARAPLGHHEYIFIFEHLRCGQAIGYSYGHDAIPPDMSIDKARRKRVSIYVPALQGRVPSRTIRMFG